MAGFENKFLEGFGWNGFVEEGAKATILQNDFGTIRVENNELIAETAGGVMAKLPIYPLTDKNERDVFMYAGDCVDVVYLTQDLGYTPRFSAYVLAPLFVQEEKTHKFFA